MNEKVESVVFDREETILWVNILTGRSTLELSRLSDELLQKTLAELNPDPASKPIRDK